jgi:linoleoyl-CoA desaturase
MAKALKFNTKSNQEFVTVLRDRVDNYFKSNNLSKSSTGLMVFKTLFHFSCWLGLYLLIMLGGFSLQTNYVLWGLLGCFVSLTAVNIGHDAIHGAYSKKKWINDLLSLSFDMNGASSYMWHFMHNTAHHTYTNVADYDGDIELLPIIRLSPNQKLKPIHKFQHIFTFFFYGLATFFWVFIKDYRKFFQNTVGNYSGKKHSTAAKIKLFSYKAVYYLMFIVLPLLTVYKGEVLPFILSFFIMHFFAGFLLGIIFMLAHIVETTHFPTPDNNGSLENSWAVHQLYTTSNFARKSRLAGFITGGLNMQVEHHLFPNICSIHYRQLAPIVKKTAHEFNVPYLEEPSFWSALASHVRFLKRVGSEENYQPVAPKIYQE